MLGPKEEVHKDPFDYSILIVCEDSKSAVYYFEEKVKACNIYNTIELEEAIENGHQITEGVIDVDGGSGSAPTSVVKYAIRKRNQYNAVAIESGLFPYKEVYCVIDTDDHSDLDQALEIIEADKATLAKEEQSMAIVPIISNECFELWYVLHFIEYSTKPLHRPIKELQHANSERLDKIIEQYLGTDYEKGRGGILRRIQKAKGNEEKAIQHAKKLLEFHITDLGLEGDEQAYYNNPSTKVHQLIERLNRLKNRFNKTEKYSALTFTALYWKIKNHSSNNIRLLLSDKDDEFLNKIVYLINKFYPEDSLYRKRDLFLDLFEHPEANTVCAEFPKEIAIFFYSEYYRWKKRVQE